MATKRRQQTVAGLTAVLGVGWIAGLPLLLALAGGRDDPDR